MVSDDSKAPCWEKFYNSISDSLSLVEKHAFQSIYNKTKYLLNRFWSMTNKILRDLISRF